MLFPRVDERNAERLSEFTGVVACTSFHEIDFVFRLPHRGRRSFSFSVKTGCALHVKCETKLGRPKLRKSVESARLFDFTYTPIPFKPTAGITPSPLELLFIAKRP